MTAPKPTATKPYPEPTKPLIVCGFPRSGTLMCAQLLSASPEVELQGEMGRPDETLRFLETIKAHQDSKGPTEHWVAKSYDFAFDIFAGVSRARRAVKPGAVWRGHKTPRQERFFARYEALFDRPDAGAHYVYCLRNPWSVWRSLKIMHWNKIPDVDHFVELWTQSIGHYETMVAQAPGRVHLFHLEAFIAAEDKTAFTREHLYLPLGVDETRLKRAADEQDNNNAAAVKAGRSPPALEPTEVSRIGRDPGVRRALALHFPGFEPPPGADMDRPPFRKPWLARLLKR